MELSLVQKHPLDYSGRGTRVKAVQKFRQKLSVCVHGRRACFSDRLRMEATGHGPLWSVAEKTRITEVSGRSEVALVLPGGKCWGCDVLGSGSL